VGEGRDVKIITEVFNQMRLQTVNEVMRHFGYFLFLAVFCLSVHAAETNSIVWNRTTDRVNADVSSLGLSQLLEQITAQTGWRVYVEPGTTRSASAKFKNLPSGEALRMLFGDLNFALVPQTNAASRLYVFTTKMQNATRLVRAPRTTAARHVANELLVKLKPGADIDALAKLLGAKVIGRNDKLGIYRLQFGDAATTDAALGQLQNNSDVADVDYNYIYDVPTSAQRLASASAGPVSLTLNPSGGSGQVIVGLIDTPVQSLDASLAQFLLKQLSVTGDAATSGSDPTHGTAMAETILRALAAASDGSTSAQILSGECLWFGRKHNELGRGAGHSTGGGQRRHRAQPEPGRGGGQYRFGQHHSAGHRLGHSRFCGGGEQHLFLGDLSGGDDGCDRGDSLKPAGAACLVCELWKLRGSRAVGHEHHLFERRGLPGAGNFRFNRLRERNRGREQGIYDLHLGADCGGDAEKIRRAVEIANFSGGRVLRAPEQNEFGTRGTRPSEIQCDRQPVLPELHWIFARHGDCAKCVFGLTKKIFFACLPCPV
jgi:hypothetical protein